MNQPRPGHEVTSKAPVRRQASVLLAQADLLLIVSEYFRGPLDPKARGHRPEDMRGLVHAASGRGALERAMCELIRVADRTSREAWRSEGTRLFQGPVACPVNETAYVRRDKGILIGDICGFYTAFGFEPADSTAEKPDHLIAELEFVSMLHVMAANETAREEEVTTATNALVAFLVDHLGEWLPHFCDRLRIETRLELFVRLADCLREIWDGPLVETLGVPPLNKASAPVVDDEESAATPYECGMADAASCVPRTDGIS